MGKKTGGKKAGGNAGVGVDFKKVKHKVGKRLPKAQNETRTDFKAKAISLPSQSVAADKGGAAVSARNLTLAELLGQTGHHSERVRKDALNGLAQLLTAHPEEARRHAPALLERLAARLADGDAGVREALLALLRGAALPALGAATLAPFLPMLAAHLEAAMTHLDAPVRLDALLALEAIASASPAAFAPAGGRLAPCLAHYAALLSRAHRGRSVKAQALAGLSKVAASLRRFLAAALPQQQRGDDGSGNGATAAAAAASSAGGAEEAADAGAGHWDEAPLMAVRAAWGPKPEALGPAQLLALYTGAGAARQQQGPHAGGRQLQQRQQAAAHLPAMTKPPKAVSKKRKLHVELGAATEEVGPAAAATAAGGAAAAGAAAGIAVVAAAAAPKAAAAGAGAGAAAAGGLSAAPSGGLAAAQAAALPLLAALAACWRECAPATLSAAPELEQAQALVDILACASALVHGLELLPAAGAEAAALQRADAARAAALAAAAAGALLPAVVPAFPATAPAARPPAAVGELVADLNVRAARLLADFLAAGVQWPPRPDKASPAELAWGATLLRYLHGALATGRAVPPADALSADAAASSSRSRAGMRPYSTSDAFAKLPSR